MMKMTLMLLFGLLLPFSNCRGEGSKVEVDKEGRVLLNGKPFFAYGYAGGLPACDIGKKHHINTLVLCGVSFAEKEGLMAVSNVPDSEQQVRETMRSPSLLGYCLGDDITADMLPRIQKRDQFIKNIDQNHPTTGYLMPTPELMDKFSFLNISMPYSYCHLNKFEGQARVFDAWRKQKRYFWTTMTVTAWGYYERTLPFTEFMKYPAVEQIRLLHYMAISHGARGLTWHCGRYITPENNCYDKSREIEILACELEVFGPMIVAGDDGGTVSVDKDDVEAGCIDYQGSKLIILRKLGKTYARCVDEGITENIEVSLDVPNSAATTAVYRVSFPEAKKIPFKKEGSRVSFNLDRMVLTELILVTADSSLIKSVEEKLAVLLPDVAGYAVEMTSYIREKIRFNIDILDLLNIKVEGARSLYNEALAQEKGAVELLNTKSYKEAYNTARESQLLYRRLTKRVYEYAVKDKRMNKLESERYQDPALNYPYLIYRYYLGRPEAEQLQFDEAKSAPYRDDEKETEKTSLIEKVDFSANAKKVKVDFSANATWEAEFPMAQNRYNLVYAQRTGGSKQVPFAFWKFSYDGLNFDAAYLAPDPDMEYYLWRPKSNGFCKVTLGTSIHRRKDIAYLGYQKASLINAANMEGKLSFSQPIQLYEINGKKGYVYKILLSPKEHNLDLLVYQGIGPERNLAHLVASSCAMDWAEDRECILKPKEDLAYAVIVKLKIPKVEGIISPYSLKVMVNKGE